MPSRLSMSIAQRAMALGFVAAMCVALITSGASGIIAQRASSASASKGTHVLRGAVHFGAARSGAIDLATLPAAHAAASARPSSSTSPAQAFSASTRSESYQQHALTHPAALPKATAAPSPQNSNMYANGALPVLTSHAEGLNSSQTSNCCGPDQAITAAPGYVFEGVNDLMAVYSATSAYPVKYGPWTPETFFAPIRVNNSSTFIHPQITFDAERSVYLIAWLEEIGYTDYIDIAISKTSTPSPLGNFYLYQIDPQLVSQYDFCDLPTLGYDYWGMYVTCVTYSGYTQSFIGNNTFAFSLNNMLSGSLGYWDVWGSVSMNQQCSTSCTPAARLSPAIEDGAPQAEWIAATDQGSNTTSSNLTLCAITGTRAVGSSAAPTASCVFNSLPLSYDDPIRAAQKGGGPAPYPDLGFKQIAYRNGRLYFAITMAMNCSGNTHDGILWADVVPQLTTIAAHNPQLIQGMVSNDSEAGYFCYSDADAYTPTLIADTEDDIALVFNYSSANAYPSIVYTGRSAADAPGVMGQTGASSHVVDGVNEWGGGGWGDYSACALTTNLVTRGIVYCGGEWAGPNASISTVGWDTELYGLRME